MRKKLREIVNRARQNKILAFVLLVPDKRLQDSLNDMPHEVIPENLGESMLFFKNNLLNVIASLFILGCFMTCLDMAIFVHHGVKYIDLLGLNQYREIIGAVGSWVFFWDILWRIAVPFLGYVWVFRP